MNTADVLKYGHLTFMGALDGLSDEAMTTRGVCGWWSAREIIAHLASYEFVLVDILQGLVGQPTTGQMLTAFKAGLVFNDLQVAAREGNSVSEVLAEYQAEQAQVMNLVSQLPAGFASQAGSLPWYGSEYSLNDFIVYTYYGHKREHSAQIAILKDRLAASS